MQIAHAGVITDAPGIPEIILNFFNLLLSIFGILGIIALVVSGMIYFFSAGNEKLASKAKKGIYYGVLGTIAGLGGMIIIKTIGKLLE